MQEMYQVILITQYYAASKFLDKVTDAYLINGALAHFGMENIDDKCTRNIYEGLHIDDESKKAYVVKVISDFVDQHVLYNVPELPAAPWLSSDLQCSVCGKAYKHPSALRKHKEKEHDIKEPERQFSGKEPQGKEPQGKEDKVKNYTHELLVMLLLRLNHNDAIKLADSPCLIRIYRYFCLYFKVSYCPKYTFAMLHLQAQVKCLLSPRIAHSRMWNRFVNNGQLNTNHPMDLEIEHDNKSLRPIVIVSEGKLRKRQRNVLVGAQYLLMIFYITSTAQLK